ncbi:unnamed protein product [Anisakis simplex]|uniref:C-type lectin domain-containing protein n=1 Tax=Anisakis simplex TaxID=6269 RepID=A0A0M3K9Q0_ANISI|nr:unnamed protein product [Anisakis simplex]
MTLVPPSAISLVQRLSLVVYQYIFHSEPRKYWLGGKQDTNISAWYWQDNSPFNYTNWHPGQPDDYFPPYPMCVVGNYYNNSQWADNTCSVAMFGPCNFICKKNANSVAPNEFKTAEKAPYPVTLPSALEAYRADL